MNNFILRFVGALAVVLALVVLLWLSDGVRNSPTVHAALQSDTATALRPKQQQAQENDSPTPSAQPLAYNVRDIQAALPLLDTPAIDTCSRLPAEPLFYDLESDAGARCVYRRSGVSHRVPPVWSGLSDNDCYSAILAQNACHENARIEASGSAESRASYCGRGFEVNCNRFRLDILDLLLADNRPIHRTPDSLCAGVTVNGIGYPDYAAYDFRIDEQCLLSQDGLHRSRQWCDFLGERITVADEFCDTLTSCVEPALLERYDVVDTMDNGVWIFDFPSGQQGLDIQVSCSRSANDTSLHRYEHYCRAIDINVHDNYGNLRRDSRVNPVSTMPPEVVSIMSNCGVVWGGFYNGSQDVWQGCDPMEFAFAPACTFRSPTEAIQRTNGR